MSPVTEDIRNLVRQRAHNRCEYCATQQDYSPTPLEIDHIVPQSDGGSDDLDNLCLACAHCNRHKAVRTTGIDPETGDEVDLFNPRSQVWSEHFNWREDGTELIGLTACGRATIDALRINALIMRNVRHNWVMAGWHPPSPID